MRQLNEVGVIQLDVEIMPFVIAVLDILDRTICRVVVYQRDHAEAIPGRGGKLLSGHEKAAVAADGGDGPAPQRNSRAQSRRESPSERDIV